MLPTMFDFQFIWARNPHELVGSTSFTMQMLEYIIGAVTISSLYIYNLKSFV